MDDSRQTPWFSIGAADHLARGQEGSSLDDKLAAYLSSQGESLKDYPHSYLVTAPRFLGYVFSPVSFWFLFSSNLRLEAMILEVNNTFDERRMYFMKRGIDTDIDAMGEEAKFAHTWPKDFHVSPFNSRKGDYSLAAINPFTSTNPKIDNVITLKSSKGHTKIIARLFSTDPAIDPAHMGDLETIRLVSSWFWTGFLTFPRILKEAAILFFKHKLHVWYRPEVAKTSIGRRPTNRERLVESIFQSFLHEQVRLSPTPTSLTCIPPTGSTTDTLHFTSSSSSTNKQTPPRKSLTLQILTPQFYTDIATSSIPADYISASTNQPSELQTFATTSHQDLARLLTTPAAAKSSTRIRITTSVRAYILSALRRRRRRRRQKSKRAASHVLDEWVLLHGDTLSDQQRDAYFKCATALVIAGRGLAGFDVVLDWMVQAMQIGLVWLGTGFILGLRHNI
ncbi:MAG: hypothetical protein GOMPHAMPRED_007964 [Gomphillus americanus]|uniref:Uncharacterized protein n=1 Tax=Gomphillus americanus TaxID=1940652 RepID=A0A8H3EVR0_9LECA|nr:MAG: hypothetical protein GOMPHAMPRED_007964 [Gomphillus americanus]